MFFKGMAMTTVKHLLTAVIVMDKQHRYIRAGLSRILDLKRAGFLSWLFLFLKHLTAVSGISCRGQCF